MDLREWLILGGALLVALILFDGWRRVSGRRRRIKLDIDASLSGIGADSDGHNPELPNGGARVKEWSDIDSLTGGAVGSELANTPEIDAAVAEMNADLEREASMLSGLSASRESVEVNVPTDTGDFVSTPRRAEKATAKPEGFSESQPVSDDSRDPNQNDSESLKSDTSDAELIEIEPNSIEKSDLEFPADDQTDPEEPGLAQTESLASASLDVADTLPIGDTPQNPGFFDAHTELSDSQNVDRSDVSESSEVKSYDALAGDSSHPRDAEVAGDPGAADQNAVPAKREQSAKVREPEFGEMDDLFAIPDLDFDRPIHEILDQESQEDAQVLSEAVELDQKSSVQAATESEPESLVEDEPKPQRKSRRRKAESKQESANPEKQTDNLFDALLDQVDEAEPGELDDIDSLLTQKQADSESNPAIEADIPSKRQLRQLDFSDPELALAIFVVAPKGSKLSGRSVRALAEACGMEFGQQNLFHRFEDETARSPIQFSMSDAVNSGQFSLETLDEYETPAVSLFMSLAESRDPMYAFECMLATAETLAKNLQAELLDSERSVLRSQTKEHLRERVSAFQLKQRSKKRRGR